eukprot:366044-Chlamydomonas_euryale.AAC.7
MRHKIVCAVCIYRPAINSKVRVACPVQSARVGMSLGNVRVAATEPDAGMPICTCLSTLLLLGGTHRGERRSSRHPTAAGRSVSRNRRRPPLTCKNGVATQCLVQHALVLEDDGVLCLLIVTQFWTNAVLDACQRTMLELDVAFDTLSRCSEAPIWNLSIAEWRPVTLRWISVCPDQGGNNSNNSNSNDNNKSNNNNSDNNNNNSNNNNNNSNNNNSNNNNSNNNNSNNNYRQNCALHLQAHQPHEVANLNLTSTIPPIITTIRSKE